MNQPTKQSTNQPTNQPINQPKKKTNKQKTNYLHETDQFFEVNQPFGNQDFSRIM